MSNFGKSLTGARYSTLKYGPCPDQYRPLYNALVSKGYLKEKKNHTYEILCEPDLSLFDDREKETLDLVVSYCKKLGKDRIYKLSHKEKGYLKTGETSLINYKFAKDLLLSD